MNRRIIKKSIKMLIRERDLPMMTVYPPLEQFLDFTSTSEWLSCFDKTPSRKNLKRFWSYKTKHSKRGYNYNKSTYNFLVKEKGIRLSIERGFKKYLRDEGLLK